MKNIHNISVVISAFNEEARIAKCLSSVASFGEVIVVDNQSNDKTVSIAKKYGAKVYERENNPMLNINKNFGFSKSTHEWILNLDADEQVTEKLVGEIDRVLSIQEDVDGYWIPRKNIIFGKWIQGAFWWPDYQLRLFKKTRGKFPEEHVHEYLHVDGKTEKLTEPIVHENYQTVSQYLYKLDKIYTENETARFLSSGKKLYWVDAIRFPVSDFLKTFFLQKGYKDGLHGLVLSILQAFYAEVVFVKIWERQGFWKVDAKGFVHEVLKEFRKVSKEFAYWILSTHIEESQSSTKRFFYRIWRKIQK